ncbi:MAG: hypothetical protein KKF46_02090 [Nanoarchaeota archaeon]|nr:hypothetical protein [Nanoarchaeota archaeon]MBU1321124.1 hypothetical protein [Nanoarchaeota archaeon]MBU1597506.1 hypothetical protein [Nanoarchaeota archaeon]MBU2442174.1 hypothetical protein [Nanoarchaeota archaeon]
MLTLSFWDPFEGKRFIYLIDGQQHLIFLGQEFQGEVGVTNVMNRYLIDSYPVTEKCNADPVFELMLRDYAVKK